MRRIRHKRSQLHRAIPVAICALALGTHAVIAQRPTPPDTSMRGMSMAGMSMEGMQMTGPLGIPMERSASGTTWIPDAVSIPSRHVMAGSWDLMLHGFAFAQYDDQGGPRGATQFGSTSWGMLMAAHDFALGRIQLRGELSLDAAGVGAQGYPELLQTGETYHNLPLHDRQHPHNLFMEASALWDRAISSDAGIEVYLAPSGEPALGPVAFMHRPSAMDNPMAPISHHWQDATHVSFGVITAGIFTRRWKFEGSIFNGQDPDQNRWNFDFHPLASYSGRIAFSPDSAWSLSASYGFIKSPELGDAGHSMHRIVGAIQNGGHSGADRQWASTFLWSANEHSDQPGYSNSVLAETEMILDNRNTIFARAEFAQKPADDLALTDGPDAFPDSRSFDVASLSIGYIRELTSGHGATLGLGAEGTLNLVPSALAPAYGSRTPVGAMVFLRLRAARVPRR